MSIPTPSIPGVDRNDLAAEIKQYAFVSDWVARRAANTALAHIAAHQELRACTCGAKYDRCPDCAADDAYEKGRKDAACEREHDDEWVEVDDVSDLPDGTRVRREWAVGVFDGGRRFIHRDDLPDDRAREAVIQALDAVAANGAKALAYLRDNGFDVVRREER